MAIQKYRQTYGVAPPESWVDEYLTRTWTETRGTVPGRTSTIMRPYVVTDPAPETERPVTDGPSPCGRVTGDSADNRAKVRHFCQYVIGEYDLDEFVVWVDADGPMLHLRVTPLMAAAMQQD